jgi:hypothetical protein
MSVHIGNAVEQTLSSSRVANSNKERGENGINKSNMNSNCINYSAFNNFCSAFQAFVLKITPRKCKCRIFINSLIDFPFAHITF